MNRRERSSGLHRPRPLGTTGAPQGFWEHLPARYGAEPLPLLVFLHGLGENGDGDGDLGRVTAHGPPRLIEEGAWPPERPFVVLSPQRSGEGCPRASEVHAFLSWAIERYAVDRSRVYLTGLSCGAIGAWRYAGEHLDTQVAAMVPIAGDGRQACRRARCALGRLPIWAFHGEADRVVDPAGTTDPMARLSRCRPPPRAARTTLYEGVGHDSWTRTYDLSAGHDVYAWMLEFRRA